VKHLLLAAGSTPSRDRVNKCRAYRFHEIVLKPFFLRAKNGGNKRKTTSIMLIKQRSWIMLAIITLLYREYCRACLAGMQRHRLGAAK
jgi:hypothetical protein